MRSRFNKGLSPNFASNIKGTLMEIEKVLINDCLRVSKVSENFAFQLFIILH